MDEKRYNEVCKLLASYITFPLKGIYIDDVSYLAVRCLTVCNDAMRDKVKDYAKQWIEQQKETFADLDVEEHLDCAMHTYDTMFCDGNPCTLF